MQNYSMAIFVISDEVRALACTYEIDTQAVTAKRTTFKTLDPNIKVDDYVVVPTDTRHRMTVVKVVEADLDVDVDDEQQVDWIIGVVDRADHEKLLAQENEAISKIKASERRRKRRELRESMLDDTADLKTLAIATSVHADDKDE